LRTLVNTSLKSRLPVWAIAGLLACAPLSAQPPSPSQLNDREILNQLKAEIAALQARVAELDKKLAGPVSAPAAPSPPPAEAPVIEATDPHDHMVQLPGGPKLSIRGFGDVNLGFGQTANPLIFPLGAPAHTTFQLGELDLFLQSTLSSKIRFVSEIVIGSEATNEWGLDIERLQITYKPSPYFQISGGRYHTSIGYYNTAYHHGTWFQTATGRPFMYFFEDSGGLLPVHSVGVTADGDVRGTEKLGLHWIAEMSNGRTSSLDSSPVQNFLSDRTHKAFNLAAYIRPQALSGLQIGGSYYRDRLAPPGSPPVSQTIGSLYAVYLNSGWESLNEAVLISNRPEGSGRSLRTPLMSTQLAYRVRKFRPYFRYQYVNGAANDPVNIFTGRYQGPSFGLRMDFSDYVAWKLQYNRLYQRDLDPKNGLDAQVAFTF
jgi:hypothetical protein